MRAEIYEVIAQGARYWFLFLMSMIVWRCFRWLARDRKERRKRLRLLPDSGFVGEMAVQHGTEECPEGTVFPIPREGLLGNQRSCDLFIPTQGIAKKHLWFRYEYGKGILIKMYGRNRALLEGEVISRRNDPIAMQHGQRLVVGAVELRLRMFAAFETTAHADYQNAVRAGLSPEQLALWQQQYWTAPQEPDTQTAAEEESTPKALTIDPETGMVIAREIDDLQEPNAEEVWDSVILQTENGFAQADEGDAARGLFAISAEEEAAASALQPLAANETVFAAEEVFYPPVQEDESIAGAWAYTPQTDEAFENRGEYLYPEYEEELSQDEDLTDAAAPPKSVYVGTDEAERAKRLVWDKYLGGRHRNE